MTILNSCYLHENVQHLRFHILNKHHTEESSPDILIGVFCLSSHKINDTESVHQNKVSYHMTSLVGVI